MTEGAILKRTKKMMVALAVSGCCNLLFGALYLTSLWQTRPSIESFHYKPYLPGLSLKCDTNSEVIRKLRSLKIEKLAPLLQSRQIVEEGIQERELALATLTAFHDFDLSRAIGVDTTLIPQRGLVYGVNSRGEPVTLTLYPSLTEQHYQRVIRFLTTEKWPFTPAGLLKRLKIKKDPSLAEAFYLTPHFAAVSRLFSRSGITLEKELLLQVLLDGEWGMVLAFMKEQREAQNLSLEKRREWLMRYLEAGSKRAAEILLKTDQEYIAKKFTDGQLLQLLKLLDPKIEGAEPFLRALLTSPKSEAVWNQASALLYKHAGEEPPEQRLHHAAVGRFIAQKESSPSKAVRYYDVQEGDSLWKIAKKFHVSIEALRDLNNLESDTLFPGMRLRLAL